MFSGILADKYNRAYLLGGASICWSACTLASGEVGDFTIFCLLRVLYGTFASCVHPPAYGIIRDSFPPQWRTTAISIYSFSGFLGGGIASFSIGLIQAYGWQQDYDFVGITGIIIGILCVTLVEDPERGKFDKKTDKL